MKKIIGLTFLWLLISLNTFASVPTVAPSNAVFSNITSTSMRLTWTSGNGNRRIIIASKDAAPSAVLTISDYAITGTGNFASATTLGNGKVVYNSSGSAVNLSNLDIGSLYYFHIYEYNLISGVYYVNTVNPSAIRLSASQETAPLTPTIAPSNPVFTDVTPTSMRLAWTNGNGSRRLVIASQDAVPNTIPTLAHFSATPDWSYGNGPAIGNGYIVANTTGNAAVVTNLWNGIPGTTVYYFHVYEYNIINSVYYINTANPTSVRMSASNSPLPWTPTIAPSNPVFTNISYQSMTVSWTPGNGTRRLVIASKDNAPSVIPDYFDFGKTANSSYGNGTAIGNGFIVYNGSQNSFNLTNLNASSQYYFHVYEFNIINNEYSYDTDLRLAANTSTIALAAPTVITSGPITYYHDYLPSTDLINYLGGKGNGNGRMVVTRLSTDPISVPTNNTIYHAFNPNTTPALNWNVGNSVVRNILDINGTYYRLSNLLAGTNYCVDVFEFNGDIAAGTAVFNTTPFTYCLKTPQAFSPVSGATNPVFSDITTNSMKFTWTNGSGNRRMVIARKDSLPRAINSTDFYSETYSRSYIANAAYGLGSSLGEGFVVYIGTENSVSLTNLDPSGNYFFHVYEMNEYYWEIIRTYYAVNNRLGANATAAAIVLTPTVGSSNISFTSVTSNSLTLNWTKGNGTNRIVIARKGSAPDADPSNGQSYAANGAFGSGSALGNGFVVYNGDGNTANITNLEAGTEYFFTIIEYNSGTGAINYASGLKIGSNWSTSQPDADADGVADADDEYPQDAYKAFNTNYPATGFGTLMFEDLWPGKGDYDFNDLVLNYRYNVVSNAAGNVVEVKYTFVTRAIGGSLHNGFAFQLDGIPANRIAAVTGAKTNGIAYATFNNNGTEANQTFANIIVFKNAYELLQHTGGYSFVNVDPQAPNVGTDTTVITVKFLVDGVSPTEEFTAIEDFTHAKFNPYIVVGQTRGKEVHLPNRAPSSLVNSELFGTMQDNSIPAQGRYYKTASELPWALDITESIPYTTEKTDFTEAFLKFGAWAISNGTAYTDWYLDLPEYRNNSKIYSK
ncbi:MAG: LruC domain-containing protein [Bacteroidia bacterium]|nr:LruC domain-containing protein [Bacteroidia bacterium]